MIAVVKGLEDSLTKGEILSKVEKLDLDDTITFVEAHEMGKRDLAKLGQPTLASQALEVKIKGTCWRCSQGGHYGNAEPEILKKVCKAFNSKCTKCEKVGHFTKQCKPREAASPKQTKDHLETQHFSVMQNRVTTNLV